MPVTCTELEMMWVLRRTLGVVLLGLGSGGRGCGPCSLLDIMSSSGCWCIGAHDEAVLGYPAKDELLKPLVRGEALLGGTPSASTLSCRLGGAGKVQPANLASGLGMRCSRRSVKGPG